MRPVRSSRTCRRGGGGAFTLVELILAMSCTALIAVAVGSILFAAARGTADTADQRALVLRQKMATARLGAALRGCRMVLQSGPDYVVLWVADRRPDGVPNVSELRRIERSPATGELVGYEFAPPAGWTAAQIEAADAALALTDDFNAVTTALKSTGHFPGQSWATGVTAWSLAFNRPAVRDATLVSYRLTIQPGAAADTAVGAAAVRNR